MDTVTFVIATWAAVREQRTAALVLDHLFASDERWSALEKNQHILRGAIQDLEVDLSRANVRVIDLEQLVHYPEAQDDVPLWMVPVLRTTSGETKEEVRNITENP